MTFAMGGGPHASSWQAYMTKARAVRNKPSLGGCREGTQSATGDLELLACLIDYGN